MIAPSAASNITQVPNPASAASRCPAVSLLLSHCTSGEMMFRRRLLDRAINQLPECRQSPTPFAIL